MYCPNCGIIFIPGSKFCTGCGKMLPDVPEDAPPASAERGFNTAFSGPDIVAYEKPAEQDIEDTLSGAHAERAQAELLSRQPQPDPPPPRQDAAVPVTEAGLYYANMPSNTAWAPLPPVDAAAAQTRLRPMSLGEVFDKGLGIFRANFTEFVKLSAIVALPVYCCDLISNIEGLKFFGTIGIVYSILFGLVVNGAMIKSASDAYLGAHVTMRYSLDFALRRFFQILFASLLYCACLVGGFIVLVVPCIILMIMYFFFAHVVIIENRSGVGSLSRSSYLVQGHWWGAFAVVFFGSAFLYVPIISASIIAEIAGGLSTSTIRSILNQSFISIVTLFITPILPIISTVFYYNLRTRRDGLDIELACEELWT